MVIIVMMRACLPFQYRVSQRRAAGTDSLTICTPPSSAIRVPPPFLSLYYAAGPIRGRTRDQHSRTAAAKVVPTQCCGWERLAGAPAVLCWYPACFSCCSIATTSNFGATLLLLYYCC